MKENVYNSQFQVQLLLNLKRELCNNTTRLLKCLLMQFFQ